MALVGLLVGCAGNPIRNQPLTTHAAPAYDFGAWIDAHDSLSPDLVALSFSGGGVRATALAASVSSQLHELGLESRMAIVSSTSGGSVAAGFLAAQGAEHLSELSTKFLLHDNQSELTPALIGDLLSGANRSQRLASYLDQRLFDGRSPTYQELMRRWDKSPFVILNASDMSSGQTFEFTQTSFNSLCSDIGSFRVSEAVAASAAFPFLMSPVTLANHWNVAACRDGPAPFSKEDYDEAVKRRYFDLGAFVRWRHRYALRHTYDLDATPPPYRRIEYLHLLDGGLSDNLAARALLRAFADNIDRLLAKGVRRLLLVQVNAKSDPPQAIDHSPDTPSLLSVFKSVALNPIDVTTALSSYVSREYMVALVRSVNGRVSTSGPSQLRFYPVQVDFDQLETASADQVRVKALDTRWTLPASDIKLLGDVGKQLLQRHPCFQAFVRDAGVAGVPTGQAADCDQFIDVQIAQHSPPPPPAAALPPPPPAPVSEKVTFAATAFFEFDKAVLKPEDMARLDELVGSVEGVNLEVIITVGHTDSSGTDAYNQRLSKARAEAVKAYLVSKGIEKNRIYTESKGAKQPIASNQTAQGRARNRRVEIELVGTRTRGR